MLLGGKCHTVEWWGVYLHICYLRLVGESTPSPIVRQCTFRSATASTVFEDGATRSNVFGAMVEHVNAELRYSLEPGVLA